MTPNEDLPPELQAAITDLRLSLTSLAESAPPRPAPQPTRAWQWTLATAFALLVAAAVPAIHHAHPAPPPIAQPTQQEDEALLEGISRDLSALIAPALKPLTPTH